MPASSFFLTTSREVFVFVKFFFWIYFCFKVVIPSTVTSAHREIIQIHLVRWRKRQKTCIWNSVFQVTSNFLSPRTPWPQSTSATPRTVKFLRRDTWDSSRPTSVLRWLAPLVCENNENNYFQALSSFQRQLVRPLWQELVFLKIWTVSVDTSSFRWDHFKTLNVWYLISFSLNWSFCDILDIHHFTGRH